MVQVAMAFSGNGSQESSENLRPKFQFANAHSHLRQTCKECGVPHTCNWPSTGSEFRAYQLLPSEGEERGIQVKHEQRIPVYNVWTSEDLGEEHVPRDTRYDDAAEETAVTGDTARGIYREK
jgi:hypothetical protein